MPKYSNYARKVKGRRVCASKLVYLTRDSAWKQSAYYFTEHGFINHPYKCKYCGNFHLTAKYNVIPGISDIFIRCLANWFQLSEDKMKELIFK